MSTSCDPSCPSFLPAARPAPGNGLREQRLQQLRLRRPRQLLLGQHEHPRAAPPGERRPGGTQEPRRRQNERSEPRRRARSLTGFQPVRRLASPRSWEGDDITRTTSTARPRSRHRRQQFSLSQLLNQTGCVMSSNELLVEEEFPWQPRVLSS